MVEVIGIRFKKAGKVYYFDPCDLKLNTGDGAIVETARGIELGTVTMENTMIDEKEIVSPLKKVIRKADENDLRHAEENALKEQEAYKKCVEKINEHKLEMKLIEVEYTFDNNKILFYFTADGRVDFRDLVKDLASIFKTRIELRQIGVRDETKLMGGLGICGRVLCCKSYLGEFHPVSIKMAKEQGLSLNPSKISGTCGRLMCCLKYEHEAYEDILSRMPKAGSIVETPEGNGIIMQVNLLKEKVKVRLDKGNETDLQEFNVSQVKVIKQGCVEESENDIDIEVLKKLED